MNKYVILGGIIYTLVTFIVVYNFATNKEHTACIARQVGYVKQQNDVIQDATDTQAKRVIQANAMIVKATQEQNVYKPQYTYEEGTESCANVCVDILKKSLK